MARGRSRSFRCRHWVSRRGARTRCRDSSPAYNDGDVPSADSIRFSHDADRTREPGARLAPGIRPADARPVRRKRRICTFRSVVIGAVTATSPWPWGASPTDPYLAALRRELEALGHPRPVRTLFLGGGTPTFLPPRQLDELLTLARHWFPPRDPEDGEFSIEANPNDLDAERAAVLARHGVDRVSLGVQSFRTAKLQTLDATTIAADQAAVAAAPVRPLGVAGSDFRRSGRKLEQW